MVAIPRIAKLFFLTAFLGWSLFISTQTAQSATLQQELKPDVNSISPPPLPPGCRGFGLSTSISHYGNSVCCVSGYVYLNGKPTDKAEIVITNANGITKTLSSYEEDEDGPYFSTSLHGKPLYIEPGDLVTITATYGEYKAVEIFNARATRGMQIDLVLPNPNSSWVRAHLPGRHDHAMAYDPIRKQTVLFGGDLSRQKVQDDTWLWDGVRWTEPIIQGDKPIARQGHTLVYHADLQKILLFGGEDIKANYLNDLWAWDGQSWAELISVRNKPPTRRDHAMIYDYERDQLLLFGGRNADRLNDTWVWSANEDGKNGRWMEHASSRGPVARDQHSMVYDPDAKQTLLFGGLSEDGNSLDDTWFWNGRDWLELQTEKRPPALSGHTMVYHPDRGILLFGGQDSDDDEQDSLWIWNGSVYGGHWSEQAVEPDQALEPSASPLARTEPQMVYDSNHNEILLHGGTVLRSFYEKFYPAETWALALSPELKWRWEQVASPPPFSQWAHTAMSYEEDDTFLIFGGEDQLLGTQNHTFRWKNFNWEELNPSTSPPARQGHRLAQAGSHNVADCQGRNILLFGGIAQNGGYLNDTWLWQGDDWEDQEPEVAPPHRAFHTLSYDCQRGHWILFGGRDSTGEPLNDLWFYNGDRWIEKTAEVSPPPRYQATFTYNPHTKETLLFGGADGERAFNDLWSWDGIQWKLLQGQADEVPAEGTTDLDESIELRPIARSAHGAVYDPNLQRLIIAGGDSAEGRRLQDSWSWDGQAWQLHLAEPQLPPSRIMGLGYESSTKNLIGLAHLSGDNASGGIVVGQILTKSLDTPPLGTISFVNPKDVSLSQEIFLIGRGGDADDTDEIIAYEWNIGDQTLSTASMFTLPAKNLPLGVHIITYKVQDNEYTWSSPLTQKIQVTADDGGTGDAHPQHLDFAHLCCWRQCAGCMTRR